MLIRRLLALVLVMGLVAACTPGGGSGAPRAPLRHIHVLIAGVYANGRAADGSDQFIFLFNPLAQPVDLAGWSLGDAKMRAAFPVGVRIGAGQGIYVARDARGFRKVMGAPPDYVWGPPDPSEPAEHLRGGAGLALGRTAGLVILRNSSGQAVDTLVYGAEPELPATGWKGPPVPAPIAGEVLDRARDESTWTGDAAGAYARDTDSAADWWQGSAWFDMRIYRPGQTWFGYPTYLVDAVVAYASPDTTFQTVAAMIDSARTSIDLNLYDFSLVPIAQRLARAARRGVKVRLMLEAWSVNRLFDQERYVAKLVHDAGGEVRWMVNDPSYGVYGRYVFNHAKYGIIDGQKIFVQSENMVRHGVPEDPTFGNRGWGVVVDHRPLAAYLARVFESDWNPLLGDTIPYREGTPLGPPPPDFRPETGILRGSYPRPFSTLTLKGPIPVTPVLAPDHSLLTTLGVIGLMRSARNSLLIEQQYIQTNCAYFLQLDHGLCRANCRLAN